MDGLVQLEVEISDLALIRSRIKWPDAVGPWIRGGIEDLMVQFTYVGWNAYKTGCSVGLTLTYSDEELGQAISSTLSNVIKAMGGIELSEIRLTKDAIESLKKDKLEP